MTSHFARMLAFLGLAIASILFAVATGAYFFPGAHAPDKDVSHVPGSQARMLLGKGSVGEGGVTFTALGPRGRAMALVQLSDTLEAESWPFVRFSAERIPDHLQLSIFWRRQDLPQEPMKMRLGQPSGELTAYLGDHPDWRGSVLEYGFLLESAFPFPPGETELGEIFLSSPEFISGRFWSRVEAFTDGLLQPWYWTGSAPNTVSRFAADGRYGLEPFSFSVLCGLTFIVLYGIGGVFRRRHFRLLGAVAGGAGLSVCVLAGLHTKHLLDQTRSHLEAYMPDAEDRRVRAPPDWPIQHDASRIRRLLETTSDGPTVADKVVILTPGGQYRHERLFYHLLPRNTYPSDDVQLACRPGEVAYLVVDHKVRQAVAEDRAGSLPECASRRRIAVTRDNEWTIYRLDGK